MKKKNSNYWILVMSLVAGVFYFYRYFANHDAPMQSADDHSQMPTSAMAVVPAEVATVAQSELVITPLASGSVWSPPKHAERENIPLEVLFLKRHYQLSDRQIANWNKQGFDSLAIIQMHVLAEMNNKPVDELLERRKNTHVGWGKFIHDLGVDPIQLNQKLRRDLDEFSKAEIPAKPPEGMLKPQPAKRK